MATLTLRLETDPATKKKNVWVKYESDSDALPMEHEEAHRKIVAALIAGGTVTAEDMGHVHIEREGQITVLKEEGKQEEPKAVPVANKG
jgi:DNA-binding GntR family transcriptional regulator